jgi:lysozyme family protein
VAEFAPALAFILPHEGGFADNPADPGGRTNYGITQATLDAWNRNHEGYPSDVADLDVNQTGDIYEAQYWPGLEGIISQAVASKCLDIRVNFGAGGGTKIIQRAVNTLVDPPTAVDGGFGPDTLDSINAADPAALLQALADAMAAAYQADAAAHPAKAVFLSGWLKRAMDLPTLDLIAGAGGLLLLLFVGGLIYMNGGGRGRA